MDGLSQPSPLSEPQRESNWVPIGLGVVFVIFIVGVVAWFSRSQPKIQAPPPAYVANLQISGLKMSVAQNFVGEVVTYVSGTLTNSGGQTVSGATVHVVFKDALGQTVQFEDLPIRILQTSGPYPETVGMSVSPLAPGQSKTFRLAFDHISAAWNQAYPELQISGVVTK